MTQQTFLAKVSAMLEAEPVLTGAEALADLEAWDSLAVMSLMAMVDSDYGIVLTPKDIGKCATVSDVAALLCQRVGESASRR